MIMRNTDTVGLCKFNESGIRRGTMGYGRIREICHYAVLCYERWLIFLPFLVFPAPPRYRSNRHVRLGGFGFCSTWQSGKRGDFVGREDERCATREPSAVTAKSADTVERCPL